VLRHFFLKNIKNRTRNVSKNLRGAERSGAGEFQKIGGAELERSASPKPRSNAPRILNPERSALASTRIRCVWEFAQFSAISTRTHRQREISNAEDLNSNIFSTRESEKNRFRNGAFTKVQNRAWGFGSKEYSSLRKHESKNF
jgi:hypothetical protein